MPQLQYLEGANASKATSIILRIPVRVWHSDLSKRVVLTLLKDAATVIIFTGQVLPGPRLSQIRNPQFPFALLNQNATMGGLLTKTDIFYNKAHGNESRANVWSSRARNVSIPYVASGPY